MEIWQSPFTKKSSLNFLHISSSHFILREQISRKQLWFWQFVSHSLFIGTYLAQNPLFLHTKAVVEICFQKCLALLAFQDGTTFWVMSQMTSTVAFCTTIVWFQCSNHIHNFMFHCTALFQFKRTDYFRGNQFGLILLVSSQ